MSKNIFTSLSIIALSVNSIVVAMIYFVMPLLNHPIPDYLTPNGVLAGLVVNLILVFASLATLRATTRIKEKPLEMSAAVQVFIFISIAIVSMVAFCSIQASASFLMTQGISAASCEWAAASIATYVSIEAASSVLYKNVTCS